MNLLALPAFNDNYIWMLHDGRNAIVVDPGDSAPVIAALAANGLTLAGILVTHHHDDHVGGVGALRPLLKGVVHGPARERLAQPCVPLLDGDRFSVAGVSFEVLDVPGHTCGHIAYFHAAQGTRAPIVFCGDAARAGRAHPARHHRAGAVDQPFPALWPTGRGAGRAPTRRCQRR